MHNFVHGMLHGSPAALRIEAIWKEYEEGETHEARFVKGLSSHPTRAVDDFDASVIDLDRLEMALQGVWCISVGI
jgi:hypothetical protein